MNYDSIVYLNGDFLPLGQARVSVMDRGFLFGDGVYEVFPAFGENIFRLKEHLARLQASLSAIGMVNPYNDNEWEAIFKELIRKNPPSGDKSVYMQLTRGVGEREHRYADQLRPTVFAMCRPIPAKHFDQGVTAITHKDIRWDYCHIKAVSLLPSVMLKMRAHQADGSHEAILLKEGKVTEGAASNVFIVKNDRVMTPVNDNRLLSGITRDLIMELLEKNRVKAEETSVTERALRNADEIWITSSVMEIVPVIQLDGKPVGDGKPGTMWKKVNQWYQNFKASGIINLM